MDINPRPSKGRKSLLTQQAEAAGLSFTGLQVDSFLQDFPRNLKDNAANHQPRRTSGGPNIHHPGVPRISEYFTPQNTANRTHGSSSVSSNIPVPKRLALASEKSRQPNKPPRGGGGGGTGGGRPINSGVAVPHSSRVSRATNKLRRSISHESFSCSVYTTPLSRGRSQSPGQRSAGQNRTMSVTNVSTRVDMTGVKKIQPPQSNDIPTLSSMIKKIIETLKSLNYPKEFDVKSFKQMNTKDFFGICNTLLVFLVGPNNQKKEEVTYILDGLQILGYPGNFTKAHAKNPNVPHTQPYVYTLLSWLCCRVDRFLNREGRGAEVRIELESLEREVENIALQSYNRLFFKLLSEKQNDIAAELCNYRDNIRALFLEELGDHKTKEELLAMIDEKQQAKDKLFASNDPRKDTIDALKAQDEMLAVIKKRMSELEEQKLKFSNVTSIVSEETVLKSELARQQRFLVSLKETVSKQEFSHDDAEKLRDDTKTLKKQQESIEKINEDLKKEVNRQRQFLKNDETRFYEICGKFSILEKYNNLAKNFNDPLIPLIDKNPLEPQALHNWLKEVAEKTLIAKRRIDNLMSTWNERAKDAEWKQTNLDTAQQRLQDEYDKLSSELSFTCNERYQKYEELEGEVQKARADRQAIKEAYQSLAEKTMEEKKKLQKLLEEVEETLKFNAALSEYSDELDKSVDEHTNIYRLAEIEAHQMLLAFVMDARHRVNGSINFTNLPPTS